MLVAHEVLQAVVPQTYVPHDFVAGLHVPAPSQVLTLVSMPLVQLGVPHEVEALGRVHAVAVMPSQRAAHAPVPPVHPVRGDTGVPTTVLHVPAEPDTLHAWHWPVHAELQQ